MYSRNVAPKLHFYFNLLQMPSPLETAKLFCHELGHNIGMKWAEYQQYI